MFSPLFSRAAIRPSVHCCSSSSSASSSVSLSVRPRPTCGGYLRLYVCVCVCVSGCVGVCRCVCVCVCVWRVHVRTGRPRLPRGLPRRPTLHWLFLSLPSRPLTRFLPSFFLPSFHESTWHGPSSVREVRGGVTWLSLWSFPFLSRRSFVHHEQAPPPTLWSFPFGFFFFFTNDDAIDGRQHELTARNPATFCCCCCCCCCFLAFRALRFFIFWKRSLRRKSIDRYVLMGFCGFPSLFRRFGDAVSFSGGRFREESTKILVRRFQRVQQELDDSWKKRGFVLLSWAERRRKEDSANTCKDCGFKRSAINGRGDKRDSTAIQREVNEVLLSRTRSTGSTFHRDWSTRAKRDHGHGCNGVLFLPIAAGWFRYADEETRMAACWYRGASRNRLAASVVVDNAASAGKQQIHPDDGHMVVSKT